MSRDFDTKREEALRHLASSVSAAIGSKPDVLENKVIDVPDVRDAVFDPPVQGEEICRPRAHRFVEEIASLDQKDSVQDIIGQFRLVEDLLIWGHAPGYSKDNVGQEFLDNYCHALLTGPDGPLRCASPLGAFVLFGPNTLYRDHSHAPNEVYLALTGGGQWRVGRHSWRQLDASQTIFIPSNAVHAIQTNAEPLLTFSFWLEPGAMDAITI